MTQARQPLLRLCFLGTAAAESYPAPFCQCDNCRVARRNRGRDLRRRSALLVNDDLLLDFGPDVFQALQQFGLTAYRLRTLCLTHGHADHLAADNLYYRLEGFISQTSLPPLAILGPQDALDQVAGVLAPRLEEARVRLVALVGGDEVQSDGYTIRALPAHHGDGKRRCLVYLVGAKGRRFLYGTDTGPLPQQAWDMLAVAPPDLAILDATMGTGPGNGHMGMEQVIEAAARLRRLGKPDMTIIAHHFSHQANPSYEELVRLYGAHDIRVSYDGMTIDLD